MTEMVLGENVQVVCPVHGGGGPPRKVEVGQVYQQRDTIPPPQGSVRQRPGFVALYRIYNEAQEDCVHNAWREMSNQSLLRVICKTVLFVRHLI